jgi:general secretion pathway protein F
MFLLFYVVPRFSKVYESFSGELPFFSKLLIAVGSAVTHYGWILLVAIPALLISIIFLLTQSQYQEKIRGWLNKLPIIAENLRLYELSRLYRTLGMLLKGGVPITRAAGMATSLLKENARNRLSQANSLITQGSSISSAMEEAGLTTPIASRMLIVGERTGNMGQMMERIAEFHEDDLSRWLEEFGKLFEPILMLGIGLVVGTIVVLMYMPIFELATSIQ